MVLERTVREDVSYARTHGDDDGIGAGTAFGGVVGMFAILGLGLGILAFAAAFGVGDVTPATDAEDLQPDEAASGLTALLVGTLPVLAAPILALGTGAWAGHASRNSVQGLVGGGFGGVVGAIVLLAIVGIGFALGAAAAGVDAARFDFAVSPALADTFRNLLSLAGLLYLLSVFVIGGLAGALIGAIMPRRTAVPEREVVRRPVV